MARGGDHMRVSGKYFPRIPEVASPGRRMNDDPALAFALIDRARQVEAVKSALGDSLTAAALRGRKLIFVVPGREDDDMMLLMDRLDYELSGKGVVQSLPPWPPAWRPDASPSERRRILMRDIHRDTSSPGARFAIVRWVFFHDRWDEYAHNARHLIETLLDGSEEPAIPGVFFLIFSGLPRDVKLGTKCNIAKFIEEMKEIHMGRNQIIFLPPPDLIYSDDIVAWSWELARLCKNPSKAKTLRDEGLRRIGARGSSLAQLAKEFSPLVTQVLSGPPVGA